MLALNRIDVVFHRNRDILQLWHEYYDLLSPQQTEDIVRRGRHKRLELLSAIAKHLGYGKLQQIDIEKYYQPVGHFDSYVNAVEIEKELLRVLKSTETLFVLGKYPNEAFDKDLAEGKVVRKKLSDEAGQTDG